MAMNSAMDHLGVPGVFRDGGMALSSRVWKLYQIGQYLAPSQDAETEIGYEIPMMTVPAYRGEWMDPYRSERMPAQPGRLQHRGWYLTCGGKPPPTCFPGIEDADGISGQIGIYAPAVFYSEPTPCDPPAPQCCNFTQAAGKWAWAYVRVESCQRQSSIDNYMTSGRVAVEISAQMEQPLREISPKTFRYGYDYDVPKAQRFWPPYARQRYIADAILYGKWRTPATHPNRCTSERWWFLGEPPLTEQQRFDWHNWDTDETVQLIADATGATTSIFCDGAFGPATYCRVGAETTLTITNLLGTTVYTFPDVGGFGQIFTCTLDGSALLWQDNYVRPANGSIPVPKLELGVNIVHINGSFAELGWKALWV